MSLTPEELAQLTPTQQQKLLAEMERQERMRQGAADPFRFGRTYFPEYFTAPTPPFHREMMERVLAAETRRRGIIIAAPRNHSKCLVTTRRVYTERGPLPVGEVRVGDRIETLDATGHLGWGTVEATWARGVQPVYTVVTAGGQETQTTAAHRFLTPTGYRPLGTLAVGATVMTVPTTRVPGEAVRGETTQIVAIDAAGEAPTCDLTVATTHNFVADDFVLHNSTLFSFLYPLWSMAYRRRRFIVMLSSSGTQAELFNDAIKQEIEKNTLLQQDFGLFPGDRFDLQWRAVDMIVGHAERAPDGTFATDAKGHLRPVWQTRIVARGAEASIRGLRSGAYRPDLVCCDDLEVDEHVATPEQRAKLRNWFFRAVEPLMDPDRGTTVVVGTILHHDSLLSTLLAHDDVYDTYLYRAITPEGTPLWPERWPLEALDQRRKVMGSAAFNQEYMNNPLSDDDRRFRPEWFQWYTRDEVWDEGGRWYWRQQPLTVVQAYDLAISRRDQADLFAAVTLGRTADGHLVVLDSWAARLDFPEQTRRVVENYQQWHPDRVGVEQHAYQDALRQHLIATAALPVVGLKTRGDKQMRITRIAPFFETGRLWLRRATEGEAGRVEPESGVRVATAMYPLVEQLLQYPKVAHDDLVDALEMAVSLVASVKAPTWHFVGGTEATAPGKGPWWATEALLQQIATGEYRAPAVAYHCRQCGERVTVTRLSGEFYCGRCNSWGLPRRLGGQR